MVKINLKDFYPFLNTDLFISVSDEILEAMLAADRSEATFKRRMYRHQAQFSLDRHDGMEHRALTEHATPYELYEEKTEQNQLYAAIVSLPEKQAKRIYAHYVLGLSKSEIARIEAVSEKNVRKSITQGLATLKRILQDFEF